MVCKSREGVRGGGDQAEALSRGSGRVQGRGLCGRKIRRFPFQRTRGFSL